MRGDRVTIVGGSLYEQSGEMIFVYGVKHDAGTGQPVIAHDGSYMVESLGGVKSGTTGTIHGDGIKVHRTQLKDYEKVHGFNVNDFITMLPIWLDTYQQLGFFPVENVRVV